ncbi:hypothetical protein BJ322DRAFT_1164015 [Thelephora terrestris]|uniref:DUF6535 domain-containing protein n=1 Tax=Thelephora terrestris TaxID=56493 RepID=A0A9P6L304_9AGAM|nr:hypothetical protein BJ322DRAFT_1164015 [Thelephora terrestris]
MSSVGDIQVVARDDGSNRQGRPATGKHSSQCGFKIEVFLKKRDEDLNITLIVQDSGENSAALLRVILYNMNKTAFETTVPTVPDWTGPSSEIVATQVLLYLSLALTLSSVLFALLAKQLLDIYSTVGSFGSDVEGGVYLWNVSVVVSRIVLVTALSIMPFYVLFSVLAFFNLGFSHLQGLWKRPLADALPMYSLSSASNSASVLRPVMCMFDSRAKIPYFRGDRYDA